MNKLQSVLIGTRISPSFLKDVDELAKKQNRSRSNVIKLALADYVYRNKKGKNA